MSGGKPICDLCGVEATELHRATTRIFWSEDPDGVLLCTKCLGELGQTDLLCRGAS